MTMMIAVMEMIITMTIMLMIMIMRIPAGHTGCQGWIGQ